MANYDYYIFGGWIDESNACNSNLSQWRYRSYGYRQVTLRDLLALEEGTDFSFPSDMGDCYGIEQLYWDCRDDNANCPSETVSPYYSDTGWESLSICVQCVDHTEYGAWTVSQNNANLYWRTKNTVQSCQVANTTYEYGCKAGTYKVSGSGASTVCAACPEHANCATTNGHTSGILSCKAGYRKNGNSCVMCGEDTYQDSNSFSGASCTACPTADWGGHK